MSKVSIIVPIYNVEKFIERCVRCLFSQTLNDIEFIFVNDRTPDDSMSILSRLIDEYDQRIHEKRWEVRIDSMPTNSGQAAVRRHGLQLASGDYVYHCDSDDWIEKDMISEMWNLANQDDLDVVVCDFAHVKDGETVYYKGMKALDAKDFFKEVLSDQSSWAVWNKLFKRSLYDNIIFPQKGMNLGEDMVITVQLLYFCKKIGYINKPFYNYAENSASITNKRTISGIIDNYIQCYSNICTLKKSFIDKDISQKERNVFSHLMRCTTVGALDQIEKIDSLKLSYISRINIRVIMSRNISIYGKIQYIKNIMEVVKVSIRYKITSSIKL